MNVRLERNWLLDGYDVWFWMESPPRVLQFAPDGGQVWEEAVQGRVGPPTLKLPQGALEALLAAAEKVIPASHATERHLLDAITVRDRLLKLVEDEAAGT